MVARIKAFMLKGFDQSELKGSIFVTGYQGFGMVGYLASRHIAMELGLRRIGFIVTQHMPEATFYKKGYGLTYPFELYYGVVNDKKLLVLVNHGTPHVRERTRYAEYLGSWLKNVGVSEAILIGGLDPAVREKEDEKYRWIPIGDCKRKLDAPLLEEKHVIGPLALTMLFLEANDIPGVAIFAYTELYRPDPRATAVAVDIISDILGVKIKTERLLEEAKVIERIEEKKKEMLKALEGEVETEREHPMYV